MKKTKQNINSKLILKGNLLLNISIFLSLAINFVLIFVVIYNLYIWSIEPEWIIRGRWLGFLITLAVPFLLSIFLSFLGVIFNRKDKESKKIKVNSIIFIWTIFLSLVTALYWSFLVIPILVLNIAKDKKIIMLYFASLIIGLLFFINEPRHSSHWYLKYLECMWDYDVMNHGCILDSQDSLENCPAFLRYDECSHFKLNRPILNY